MLIVANFSTATLSRLARTPGYIRQNVVFDEGGWNGIWTPRLINLARHMCLQGHNIDSITEAVFAAGGPARCQTVDAILAFICPERDAPLR